MKKLLISTVMAIGLMATAFARPMPYGPNRGHHSRPHTRVVYAHRAHHRHIGPSPLGIAVGSVLGAATAIAVQSVAVQPIQKVWIPGYWQTTVLSNGVTSSIWIEGHWEYR